MKIRIGSRGSKLALWQAEWVRQQLQVHDPSCIVEIEIIKTTGDRIADIPLGAIGVKGLFTKEIEEALLERRVDVAVHSLKDVPTELPEGLQLMAITEREIPCDVFAGKNPQARLMTLPSGAIIGTSSLRRRCQLLHLRPDLHVTDLRGNIDTRLRKLDTTEIHGIILAAAGLRRLGFDERISEVLAPELMVPAIGQGALGLEARVDDEATASRLAFLNSTTTAAATTAERSFLRRLGGGCQVPIAGYACVDGQWLSMIGLVGTADGSVLVRDTQRGALTDPEALGVQLAERLLQAGAQRILDAFYGRS